MATDLTDCEIHVEQQLTSHIYEHRFYHLSIFLKCRGVPKFLDHDNEVQIISSIIAADTHSPLQSTHFVFENPSKFNKSGYTSSRFKVTCCTTSWYCIQCTIPNSPVQAWISEPFTVVKYQFGMIRPLQLIDGDKWYKDEGGKLNFMQFTMGLHNHRDECLKPERDIAFQLELVYFNDRTKVLNQEILKTDAEQQFVLQHKKGSIEIRFKIEQVSSHHQRRRFSLKVAPINNAAIGPCYTKPILVLSKRNKPKKPLSLMSPQKRKEVVTKRKQHKLKRKRVSLLHDSFDDDEDAQGEDNKAVLEERGYIKKDENVEKRYQRKKKKRKLNVKLVDKDMSDSNEDHLYDSSEEQSALKDVFGATSNSKQQKMKKPRKAQKDDGKMENAECVEEDDGKLVNRLMTKQCMVRAQQFPSIVKYEENPTAYFDFEPIEPQQEEMKHVDYNYLIAKKLKRNLVNGLRLCQDTFEVLSQRAVYYPLYGMGKEGTSKIMYSCSFCHRFSAESPSKIPHYEHCRMVQVIELLKGERSTMPDGPHRNLDLMNGAGGSRRNGNSINGNNREENNATPLTLTSTTSNTPIPLDNGVEYNSLQSPRENPNVLNKVLLPEFSHAHDSNRNYTLSDHMMQLPSKPNVPPLPMIDGLIPNERNHAMQSNENDSGKDLTSVLNALLSNARNQVDTVMHTNAKQSSRGCKT